MERPTIKVLGLRRKALIKTRAADVAAAPAPASAGVAFARLKLYQPAHQRHYLVSGSLVCQVPGLPDREVNPSRQKVSFVVRRLFPKTPVAAGQPLLAEALNYLDTKSLSAFDDADQRLMNLTLSLAHVSFAVEIQGDAEGRHAPLREKMVITRAPADSPSA